MPVFDIDLSKIVKHGWAELKQGADEALAVLIVMAFVFGAVKRLGR